MKNASLALLLVLVLAVPAAANTASASGGPHGLVAMAAHDIPVTGRTVQAVAPAPSRFNMLGAHWIGSGTVDYRTRAIGGGWTAWQAADADTGPDARSSERSGLWRDGNLEWVGASDRAQFRTHGAVQRVRAFYLWSKPSRTNARRLQVAGAPDIVPRASWHADESITRAAPIYAPSLKIAVVHHTAGSNDYTPEQAAAIVRGIEMYHVQGNGWNDIGYNFLIDRFGTVYEGRGGGITRNVVGAHAEGFNTGSVGVALIGNFSVVTPPPAMQDALVKLLAWRLDVAHIDPLSKVVMASGGNPKYPAGDVVTLRAISGHRDTGPSECPGQHAYDLLPSIATRVAAAGLPKLYSPTVTGAIGGPIRFQARLSSALNWTVTVRGAGGAVVAQHGATTSLVDWTWNSPARGTGPYRWTMGAGPSLLSAAGTIGATAHGPKPPPRTLTAVTLGPVTLTQNPDGSGGDLALGFALGVRSSVTANVTSPSGTTLAVLLASTVGAGQHAFTWDLGALPDGRYQLVLAATPHGKAAVTRRLPFTMDRTISALTLGTPVISPNGDGANDVTTIGFNLARAAPVTVTLRKGKTPYATIYSGTLAAGAHAITWTGTEAGATIPDGTYELVVSADDVLGTVDYALPLTIDTTPPGLTLIDGPSLQFSLTEPATVKAVVNGQTITFAAPTGTFTLPWTGAAVTSVVAQAIDAGGNSSAQVVFNQSP